MLTNPEAIPAHEIASAELPNNFISCEILMMRHLIYRAVLFLHPSSMNEEHGIRVEFMPTILARVVLEAVNELR